MDSLSSLLTRGARRVSGWGCGREVTPMTMQSDNKGHGLANNFWAQMAILAIVVIVVIALAAKYLW
jgi:hypothetical protein